VTLAVAAADDCIVVEEEDWLFRADAVPTRRHECVHILVTHRRGCHCYYRGICGRCSLGRRRGLALAIAGSIVPPLAVGMGFRFGATAWWSSSNLIFA
jgi:hypothetical protein